MDDASFEQIRSALAPSQERTARLGALFVLESFLDDDDRIVSLIATLLHDRDAEMAASAAALAYRTKLALSLGEELHKAWTTAPSGYRSFLLEKSAPETIEQLSSYFIASGDPTLKLSFLARIGESASENKRLFAALELARDTNPDVRAGAAKLLAIDDPDGDALRQLRIMIGDPDTRVIAQALRSLADIAPLETVAEEVSPFSQHQDEALREAAKAAMNNVHRRQSEAAVIPLIEKQKQLIAERRYDEAMALAAQVFMRVASHAGCQYQMARAAAGMGDERRALRLLANAFEGGFGNLDAAMQEPLFERLRSTDIWHELMAFRRQ